LRSGSYEVTVVLPADGRWTVQIPFHLSSRSTATPRTPEVVEVTVNGNIDIREGRKAQTKILTTADVKKGKALTPGTRHALAFKIEGGSFTVKMDFSSAKTALSEHVLVGNAVASCTSSCTKGGHQPITPLDLSKVRTRLPPPPPSFLRCTVALVLIYRRLYLYLHQHTPHLITRHRTSPQHLPPYILSGVQSCRLDGILPHQHRLRRCSPNAKAAWRRQVHVRW
jgi:hypothetical protein